MPTLVAIYARLSVDRDGKKIGIDTQLEDSRKLARDRGWKVAYEYVDRNLTAADKLVARPEYNRLVQDFDDGKFSGLICWDLDRLTRQPRQLEDWIDAAEDKGLVIVTANGEADLSTDGGRLFARMKVAVGKAEVERASERQRRNKEERRQKGLFHGGPAPFGYRVEDKSLVPEPAEVKLIEEATRRLLHDRETLHSIIKDWNDHGITTRKGKHWRQSNLRSILMNPSLLGLTKAGVKGWAAVIDKRTFDRLNALFTDPSRKVTHSPGVRGGRYSMGGGLAVCAKCEKPLITAKRGDTGRAAIGCLERVHGPHEAHPKVVRIRGGKERYESTGRVSIDHDILEERVFQHVIERLEGTERFRHRMAEANPQAEAKVDQLEHERQALREQRERATSEFIRGALGERAARRKVEEIDTELGRVDAEINELLRGPVVADVMAQGIHWKDWPPGKRRAFLKLLIDRVLVYEQGPIAPRASRRRGESDESLAERRRRVLLDAADSRIKIVWNWDS